MDKEKNNSEQTPEDDIIIEETVDNPAEAIKKLRERMKKCELERSDYLSGWQRAKADYVNARREEEERRKELKNFFNRELVAQILEVADGFDGLFKDKEKWGKIDANWRQGVENLSGRLAKILRDNGVEPIESKGKLFAPEEHQALGEVAVDKKENEGIVMDELRKGYRMNGMVIRPSLVKVGKFASNE